jgi:phenylalanyl-tRNA synthetase beta chain
MRAPLSWIRQYVDIPPDETGRDVAARIIAAGLEVETVDVLGGEVTGPVVVGRVLSIEELAGFKKPIRFCRVEVGSGNGEVVDGTPTAQRGIICGASNFVVGDLVVVALPGAVLAGGFAIGSRTTYGRLSDGMISSERELGLGDEHSGIIVLPAASAEPGDSGYDVLGLGDEVLDIAVTPDRGYALSIRGVAREIAIAYGLPFADPAAVDPESMVQEPSGVELAHGCAIHDRSGADRFVLRTLADLDPNAPSPQWMRRALVACGMRPVSLAVDVTNYVMLELGQPLHAFDRDKLTGPLAVMSATPGTPLETLDHVTRTLDREDLVIAHPRGPLALAGVMGGLSSEIDESSRNVVIEAVHFDAVRIARSSRRHRLSSEASRRFERGVDPELPAVASARAAALLVEHGGARYIGVQRVDAVARRSSIAMDVTLPARVSGLPIDADTVEERLRAIGAEVVVQGSELLVTPPSWRPDLTDPADLVEEVVRLGGYESLPATLPRARAGFGLTQGQRLRRRAGRSLSAAGLVEVLSYPFLGVSELDALGLPADDARRDLVLVANPLSDEAPALRTTLLPGLVGAARRNLSRGAAEVALGEIGLVFRGSKAGLEVDPPRPSVARRPSADEIGALDALLPTQPRHAAGLLAGERDRTGWWGPGRVATWDDAIGIVRDLATDLGVALQVRRGAAAPWHPGRCAELALPDGRVLGHAGELHPRVVAAVGLPERTVAFEVDLDALVAAAPVVAPAPALSTMPVAKEDVALVVDVAVPAGDVGRALADGGGSLVESVRLFDTYSGEQIGAGKVSLAFALRLRAADRTLSSAEVAAVRAAALAEAESRCGAVLRT